MFALRRVVRPAFMRGYAEAAAVGNIKLTFGSPATSLMHDESVASVTVPGMEGDFEVCGNHIPTVGVLRPGVVRINKSGDISSYFVSSGTVTVNPDQSVQVSVEELCTKDEIDVSKATLALNENRTMVNSADPVEKAEGLIGEELYTAMIAFAS